MSREVIIYICPYQGVQYNCQVICVLFLDCYFKYKLFCFHKITKAMVWIISNETQVNSNFEPANSSRIWLFKNPIHLKVSIKKGKKELCCFKSEFSNPFYPLEKLGFLQRPLWKIYSNHNWKSDYIFPGYNASLPWL